MYMMNGIMVIMKERNVNIRRQRKIPNSKSNCTLGWFIGIAFVILQHNLKQIKVMELKYKLLEEMSLNKLKGILDDLQEERTI